ncbi:AMP-binding protein [Priestia taiwanensis]|uniref:acetate--CoA ligase n=1 Tax=Priestia taiwanensis TaxID=1347902 RepID=A0A917AMY3_9BACI|nr:AMP-binding protein [Priestia taiwanensis]MBM7362316.1 acetyl-CoA synthetase [Priestia taiwanensis]GGE61183.1 AMP-dependent synthetase [Priestia taiwanensis]
MHKAVWIPNKDYIEKTNLFQWMQSLGFDDYDTFYKKSIEETDWFWGEVEQTLGIKWMTPYTSVLEGEDIAFPYWYANGTCNIIQSALEQWVTNGETKNRLAIVSEREDGTYTQLTYEEVYKRVTAVANGLKKQGIKKGDRITIYMPMTPEIVIAMLGAITIGAIVSPVFSGFGHHALATRINAANSKMLITADGFSRRNKYVSLHDEIEKAIVSTPSLEKVVMVSDTTISDNPMYCCWAELEQGGDVLPIEEMRSDDPCMLLYTSGTTGKPKGTVHTHTGFPIKAAFDGKYGMNISKGDKLLWITDMGWMMGPFQVFSSLINGATIVMYDGVVDYPTSNRLFELIDKHDVTHLGISPTLIRSLMTKDDVHVEDYDLTSLQVIGSTGEPWNETPWLWLFKQICKENVPIFNYSGGTEIAGGIFGNVLVKPISPVTFNSPLPGMAATIVDKTGKHVVGEVGELCLTKPWVGMTKGFWEEDERYKETYWNKYENIWVHGDLAVTDGLYWSINGRSDDTLNIAGKRIGPTDYESILVQHDNVVEAAAIGVPDEKKGEVCYCFVVTKEERGDSEKFEQELKKLLQGSIGKALCPEAIHFISDLPKTRNAKVMRRVIKASFLGEDLGDLSSLVNPESVNEIIAISQKEND